MCDWQPLLQGNYSGVVEVIPQKGLKAAVTANHYRIPAIIYYVNLHNIFF